MYSIRNMEAADYKDAVKLWKNTEGIGVNKSDSKKNITAFLKRNPNLSFVAHASDKLVGTVVCGHDGRNGYLGHLAVAKEYQKQGIGEAFVNKCLQELKKYNIPKCKIFVFTKNKKAKEFWQHIGWFKRTELTIMQKDLK